MSSGTDFSLRRTSRWWAQSVTGSVMHSRSASAARTIVVMYGGKGDGRSVNGWSSSRWAACEKTSSVPPETRPSAAAGSRAPAPSSTRPEASADEEDASAPPAADGVAAAAASAAGVMCASGATAAAAKGADHLLADLSDALDAGADVERLGSSDNDDGPPMAGAAACRCSDWWQTTTIVAGRAKTASDRRPRATLGRLLAAMGARARAREMMEESAREGAVGGAQREVGRGLRAEALLG